jgi:hypothetical protein
MSHSPTHERQGNPILIWIARCATSPVFWLLLSVTCLYTLCSLTSRYDAPVGMDEVRDVQNAWELVHEGKMPRHGTVSGLHSLSTPGTSFAYVPGILLAQGNPATAERIGATCMFFGTLLGIWLWLEGRFGKWSATLAILLFSASSIGAFFAISLWPRAHPFFYVWMLFALTLWVERRDPKFLAAAIVTYAAGIYWFMEFAPAILIVPVLYFLYRPPLGLRWLAGALTASVLIWSPYLVYESSSAFADLKSILTQTHRSLPPVTTVYYDAGNRLVDATYAGALLRGESPGVATADTKVEECDRWFQTKEWGTVWFQVQERWYLGEPGYVFYADKLGGWAFQSVTSGRVLLMDHAKWEPGSHEVAFPTTRELMPMSGGWLKREEAKIMAFAPLNSIVAGDSFGLFVWHFVFLLAALAYALRKSALLTRTAKACRAIWKRNPGGVTSPEGAVWCILLLGTVLPALALCIAMRNDSLVEGGRRFWWIWSAGASLMGCAAGSLVIRKYRPAVLLGLLAAGTLSLNANTQRLLHEAFGRETGYAGSCQAALDALAETIRKDGKTEAFIGYDLNLYSWQSEGRLLDGVSKSFEELDQYLLMRHGIRNLDTTVEGLSPQDEYVLHSSDYGYVSAKNSQSSRRWSMTIDGSLPPTETAAKSGVFEIRRRVPNAR